MNDQLNAAAQEGDIDLLYKLIQMDPYILERYNLVPFVDTPLHVAAASGHASFATEIMRLKPSFAWKLNQYGLSPMHLALQNKHYRMVCRFVDINKDLVRVKGREGLTPLHISTQTGQIDLVVKFLSACPGSIEDVTVRGETALHIAVKCKQFCVLEILLGWLQRTCHRHSHHKEKRVLNWEDEAGNTILHISVLNSFPQAVRLLIDSNIDINAKNLEEQTALDIVEKHIQTQVYSLETLEIRDMLILAGALRGISLAPTPLHEELRSKITFNESVAICVTRLRRRISYDTRNALLVIAILFATSTYEATLNPPGGGKLVMKMQIFLWFWSFNTFSFYFSILMMCLLMPRGRISVIVTCPLALFSGCYVISMLVISPCYKFAIVTVAIPCILIGLYCWGTSIYITLAKKLRMYGREREDMSKFSQGNKW